MSGASEAMSSARLDIVTLRLRAPSRRTDSHLADGGPPLVGRFVPGESPGSSWIRSAVRRAVAASQRTIASRYAARSSSSEYRSRDRGNDRGAACPSDTRAAPTSTSPAALSETLTQRVRQMKGRAVSPPSDCGFIRVAVRSHWRLDEPRRTFELRVDRLDRLEPAGDAGTRQPARRPRELIAGSQPVVVLEDQQLRAARYHVDPVSPRDQPALRERRPEGSDRDVATLLGHRMLVGGTDRRA